MKVYEASIKYSLVKEYSTNPVDSSERVYEYMQDAFEENPMQENFWVICLNRKNHPIGRTMATLGTAVSSVVSPPEIFRIAILAGATSIVVAHNHPSGDPGPSAADIQTTRNLKKCSEFMKIPVIDHIVCGDPISDPQGVGYYSFNDAGLLS